VGLTTFVAFVRHMCTQLYVTSQDYDLINYSWDWPFLLAFVRRQNIQVQPPAAGKFEIYDWPLVKIQSWGKFEIAEPFKQLQAIHKCNKMMFFLIPGQKIIMKRCAH
jgi:hypothetical protein